MSLVEIEPARRAINPDKLARAVLRNVYDAATNKRKVWKFHYNDYSYGGVISMDVMGCSFRCDYCWVDNSILLGAGGFVRRHENRGESFFLSPGEAFEKLRRYIERYKLPSVQITGGETFLTPEWTLELLRLLCEYFEQGYPFHIPRDYAPGVVWIDTQGADLMRHEAAGIFERLAAFRDHLRLFISLKAHPRDFVQRTNVSQSFTDVSFRALENAWRYRIFAVPQMIDGLFYPETAEWFFERLKRIHPSAPRVLQIDRLRLFGFLPGERNVGRMKQRGFKFGKNGNRVFRNQALATWREILNREFGKDNSALSFKDDFGCDKFSVRAINMINDIIFDDPP